MIKEEEIYSHYCSEDFKPIMPENENWRHFRFKLWNKCWKKVKQSVRNDHELRVNIVKQGGCDIYYSTSKWLKPTKISTKGGAGTYHVADNILLGNDLVFDIDAPEPITIESLEKARKSANNIYELMKDHPEFEFQYFAFTGYKGFRLSYKDNTKLPEDSRKRLSFVEKNRKVFIDGLLKEYEKKRSLPQIYKIEPFFDQKITTNVMCVVRVLGTVHSTTGYISTKLPISMVRQSVEKILNKVPYIGKKRPGIPKREMTKAGGEDNSSPCPRLLLSEEDATGLASLPHTQNHTYFITNKVLGIKRGFVPFFIYQKTQKKYYRKELLRLQKKHNLGEIYIFTHEENIVAISLKTNQRRKLQKILNESTSRTKHDFKRHRRIFAPFMMEFKEKLPFDKYVSWLSKGHYYYVEPLAKKDYRVHCGWSKIELIKAIREKDGKI